MTRFDTVYSTGSAVSDPSLPTLWKESHHRPKEVSDTLQEMLQPSKRNLYPSVLAEVERLM
jgi:hypothetical protein